VSNEELGYDIVKEAIEGAAGKPNENKKDHHHVQKDGADLLKLRHIIQVQEDNIRELQREIIELRKLVDNKRISETSNDIAPPLAATRTAATPTTATPAAANLEAGTPATATPTGKPAPTTTTTQKTEAQAPRKTRMKSVLKRKLVNSPPPAATPKATTPAATTSEAGTPAEATPAAATPTKKPAPTTGTTEKTEAQAPRRTRMKSVVKRKLVNPLLQQQPQKQQPQQQQP